MRSHVESARGLAPDVHQIPKLGKHRQDVNRIILSHAHLDHAGSARRLVDEAGLRGVSVHSAYAESIRTGRAPSTDPTTTRGRIVSRLPNGHFPPGHISLLHQSSGVLLTGDSLFNVRPRLSWSIGLACSSSEMAKRSAQRLADLEYDAAAFTYGPELRIGAREAVRGFLRREQPR
jgi:glyoxylase-like metal-dependent hydrolase (beta-lactamase superfamily II)